MPSEPNQKEALPNHSPAKSRNGYGEPPENEPTESGLSEAQIADIADRVWRLFKKDAKQERARRQG